MPIYCKTHEELALIQHSSLIVEKTLAHVATLLKPGCKTIMLDREAEQLIRDNGGEPAFKGYGSAKNPFPFSLCISVNQTVVHGLPSEYELKENDVVSVDCGVKKNGFYGDSAYTFVLGKPQPKVEKLIKTTKEALYLGVGQAKVGKRVGDIGEAIQNYCENQHGFGVVREMVGHGVGRSLHEEPEVPNFGKRGKGVRLLLGMTIAIEPMINLGKKEIVILEDGWTCNTCDNQISVHFEHTVAVGAEPKILSSFAAIEQAEMNNINLYNCHN